MHLNVHVDADEDHVRVHVHVHVQVHIDVHADVHALHIRISTYSVYQQIMLGIHDPADIKIIFFRLQ